MCLDAHETSPDVRQLKAVAGAIHFLSDRLPVRFELRVPTLFDAYFLAESVRLISPILIVYRAETVDAIYYHGAGTKRPLRDAFSEDTRRWARKDYLDAAEAVRLCEQSAYGFGAWRWQALIYAHAARAGLGPDDLPVGPAKDLSRCEFFPLGFASPS